MRTIAGGGMMTTGDEQGMTVGIGDGMMIGDGVMIGEGVIVGTGDGTTAGTGAHPPGWCACACA